MATETVYRPEDAELVRHRRRFRRADLDDDHFEYLSERGIDNCWLDMRRCFRTEQRHKGRLGRYRRIADSAAQRHETV